MSKEELLTFEGEVVEKCPNATFRVKLKDNDLILLCQLNGKMRKNNIYVLLGDRVTIEVSPYDFTKGRIIYRFKE